ncbi:hypothetical protein [Metabacillus idriensis]|uniref:hypothetical protein n=1 Tax=Metabacillus idriensis TaxID=324768 RepID=UPI00174E78DA|nr:hypothetical protein [Metabacillus idriensis]
MGMGDPTGIGEEAPIPPAESKCLQRKSTGKIKTTINEKTAIRKKEEAFKVSSFLCITLIKLHK